MRTTLRNIAIGATAAVLLLVIIGVATSGHEPAAQPATVAATATTGPTTPAPTEAVGTAASDPYEVYLATNPRPEFVLSREDAQTRAYLGCGTAFARGTVDAALAAAYRPTGICKGA